MLIFSGCVSKESRSQTPSTPSIDVSVGDGTIVIQSVFPATPVLAKDSILRLTAVVTDRGGNYLQSSVTNPISVSWESSDTSVAAVDDRGILYGKSIGKAVISLFAKQSDNKSEVFTLNVEIVNSNVLDDVAEIYFSPNRAYIDKAAERTFRLTAVDYSGAPTSLSEGKVQFEVSNSDVTIAPTEIDLSGNNEAVEIVATGVSKGYAFVTPIYSITENNSTTIKITGTPLVVQVKDPTESSKPQDTTVDAGKYLSVAVSEKDGRKIIHVSHYDAVYDNYSYSYFDGTWTHASQALPTSLSSGKGSSMVLSPFDINVNKPVVIMLQNSIPTIWYQNWPDNYWLETAVGTTVATDGNTTYQDGEKFLSISKYRSESNSSLNVVHALYFDKKLKRICLLSYKNLANAEANSCVGVTGSIDSISTDVNNISGDARFVYSEANNGIYYVSKQSGSLYREKITNTTGNEKGVVLKLDGNNVPTVVYHQDKQVGMYKRTLVGGSYIWGFQDITKGLDPQPEKIDSVDLKFDSYNEPRIVFGSDKKIRYARRVPFNGIEDKWVVESPGQSSDGEQGLYSSIFVDSQNRAHIVYSITDKKWFSYWAEPNFFDYRAFPSVVYSRADVIGG